ncbi:Maf family protein [Oscillochloris sp. ZM17-4]|uniref:Maf family protein n=1 Tax=Oscillochloris sp. ZM17-4 TaxID=2866714 RepID=UPI001C73755B|nr:Maf family protein [Oscillochloris sp. ZM17-4]MBX0330391.1 Maf family protein [Oscillochloris sp. ZM17-4]
MSIRQRGVPSVEPSGPTDIPGEQLVLASASPRRRELLAALGARYATIASDAEERDDPVPDAVLAALPPLGLPRATHPSLLAWRKASHAAALAPGAVVLGADTIVVLGDEVLNKPRDPAHARRMLASLSGRVHTVYTGLCVIGKDEGRRMKDEDPDDPHKHHPSSFILHPYRIWLDLVSSAVEIAPLSEQEIADYVATGEPMDKAGAYGIQGLGGRLVRSVRGSYTAVVGLPLPDTHRMLRAAGVGGLHDPEQSYRRWLEQQEKEPMPWPPTLP